MPEKTKENKEPKVKKNSPITNKKTVQEKNSTTKNNTTSKKVSPKKSSTKNEVKKVTKTKKNTVKKIENKKETIKEETIIEKIKSFLAKIADMQEEAKRENNEGKESIKKDKKSTKAKKDKNTYILEYYDLPYRYNETVVKILAQTPKKLFVYWDVSDSDRQKYLKAFGNNFFEETYPVLLVHNQDKNYTFEVPINDFANSWYLDINDPKSKYVIELGRKYHSKPEIINLASTEETKDVVIHNDYIPITTSNLLEVPNDHILFEKVEVKALYRNVKNNVETFIDINNNEFTRNKGHIYNIYEIYKEIYKDEIKDENVFDLLNPSSFSSSTFK